MDLYSEPGKGTLLAAYFAVDNIDRPPLGNIVSSIQILLAGTPNLDLEFVYCGLKEKLIFRTQEIREILGTTCDFANPEIYSWLGNYLSDQLSIIKGKEV